MRRVHFSNELFLFVWYGKGDANTILLIQGSPKYNCGVLKKDPWQTVWVDAWFFAICSSSILIEKYLAFYPHLTQIPCLPVFRFFYAIVDSILIHCSVTALQFSFILWACLKFFGSLIFFKINQLWLNLNKPIDTFLETLDPRVVNRWWIGKEWPMTCGL